MEITEATHPAAATLTTPVGTIAVTSSRAAIVRVEWVDAESAPAPDHGDPLLAEALEQLRAYFDGRLGEFDLPLSLNGISPVATTVLTVLAETVGYGETVTYGELAARSGTGVPARAIGSIMGLNPLPLLIPCHRVVAGDGLGGYSGGPRGEGLATKRHLLEMEGALPSPLF
ncbi:MULTISPECIES: methylated-DNA--[protein]-cysteine S-methyltransferase [Brevibacterium]|uniref:Methylated-DNA--protein-cysteine methyltransferase n=1 Tax=Brevibacterium casei TaxID=33889 RepID=A0A7T4A042_9MICO|nr:methylated-DNA--[protein]-cysteine S-methyltransferase [Brevibacterium casei]QQB14880.1 methylated-DNA--[protein]-cysteine S-methyltransferase [Brevibacterium casei]